MKKASVFIAAFSCCLLFQSNSWAVTDYETVVTDTSFSTSSRSIITEQEIRDSKAPNLTALLQNQANISTSNSNFQPGSFFIRGGDASHVLILVDGVPYYDGTTSQRTINLNTININSVRRIEILKGSQSVLYGGQALSAVIKIQTFSSRLSNSTAASISLGSNGFQQALVGQTLKISDSDGISFSTSYYGKRSLSPAPDSNYRYPSRIRDFDLSYLHRDDWDLNAKFQMTSENTELAGSDPAGNYMGALDTKDFTSKTDQKVLTLSAKKSSGFFRPHFSAAYQNSDRSYEQGINELVTSPSLQTYGGENINLRGELEMRSASSGTQGLIGAQYTREGLVYRNSGIEQANITQELRGVFAKAEIEVDPNLVFVAGGRMDGENRNQLKTADDFIGTYQVGFRIFENTKLEYSTGFKNPSLFQYFGSYGNPDLKSEKSNNVSLTQDLRINEEQIFSFTFFETNFTNLIQASGSPVKYNNIAASRTRGAEASFDAHSSDGLGIKLALGYQEPKDLSTDTWLSRRPLQTGSAQISQSWNKSSAYLGVFSNGERRDQSYRYGPPRYVSLSSNVVWNAAFTLGLSDNFSAFIRGNNLMNIRYEESFGYLNEGRSFQVGLTYIL